MSSIVTMKANIFYSFWVFCFCVKSVTAAVQNYNTISAVTRDERTLLSLASLSVLRMWINRPIKEPFEVQISWYPWPFTNLVYSWLYSGCSARFTHATCLFDVHLCGVDTTRLQKNTKNHTNLNNLRNL